ncbi:MAG: LON peptidase substrate-binding domain-containing protein [Fimbriimonadaceae bacterium]|nr:LON peptidase substrate-binding domain-containing protein [Fimbriimonadaceae bacterium]
MSRGLEEIPLFPLNTVLFPYAPLQLHVFEERYRRLVQDCMDLGRPIGVVLIRSGSEVGGEADPYMVGTAARIEKVQKYDDGRMDVHVVGERRFRIRKVDESLPYMVGFCEPVVEIELEDTPRTDALTMRARESFEIYVQAMFAAQAVNVRINYPQDPIALSFLIANYLPLDNLERQRMLELTDTQERLAGLIPAIETQIVQAKTTAYYRLSREHLSEWIHPN